MSIKNWFRALFNRFTTTDDLKKVAKTVREQNKEIEQMHHATMEELRLKTRKGSIQNIRDYCDEIRKDLLILKNTVNRICVEQNNLNNKIDRFLEGGEE